MDRIPILKLGNALLVTIQVDMHDRLASALEEDLTSKIATLGAKGVLIDISALEIASRGVMLDNIACRVARSRCRNGRSWYAPGGRDHAR